MEYKDYVIAMRSAMKDVDAALNRRSINVRDRGSLITQALAKHLAYSVEIPSSPVKNPKVYFHNIASGQISTAISQANELFPFDVIQARTITYRVWEMRYNLVHNPSNIRWGKLLKLSNENIVPDSMKLENVKDATEIIDKLTSQFNRLGQVNL